MNAKQIMLSTKSILNCQVILNLVHCERDKTVISVSIEFKINNNSMAFNAQINELNHFRGFWRNEQHRKQNIIYSLITQYTIENFIQSIRIFDIANKQ